jgi:ACS family glucarate transporter-like MFS transporter
LFGIVSDWLIKIKGNTFTRKTVAGVSFAIMVIAIFLSTRAMGQLPVTISLMVADFCLVVIVLTCFSTCIDVGGDRVSTITGLMNFIGQSGSFLMSIVFGRIVDLTHNYEAPQYLMTALLLIGGICWFGIDASKKIIGKPVISPVISSPAML